MSDLVAISSRPKEKTHPKKIKFRNRKEKRWWRRKRKVSTFLKWYQVLCSIYSVLVCCFRFRSFEQTIKKKKRSAKSPSSTSLWKPCLLAYWNSSITCWRLVWLDVFQHRAWSSSYSGRKFKVIESRISMYMCMLIIFFYIFFSLFSGRRKISNLCESLLGFVPGVTQSVDWHGEISLRQRVMVDKLIPGGPLHQGFAHVQQGTYRWITFFFYF